MIANLEHQPATKEIVKKELTEHVSKSFAIHGAGCFSRGFAMGWGNPTGFYADFRISFSEGKKV